MMLPNMTSETVAALEKRGFRATPQLCQAASENPAGLKSTLTCVLGGPREASEVMQARAPFCIFITLKLCCEFTAHALEGENWVSVYIC